MADENFQFTSEPGYRVLEIPGGANVLVSYPIAFVRDAKAPDAARGFVDFVLSGEGQAILERRGLIPIPQPRP